MQAGAEVVTRHHVDQAIQGLICRAKRAAVQLQERMHRGTLVCHMSRPTPATDATHRQALRKLRS